MTYTCISLYLHKRTTVGLEGVNYLQWLNHFTVLGQFSGFKDHACTCHVTDCIEGSDSLPTTQVPLISPISGVIGKLSLLRPSVTGNCYFGEERYKKLIFNKYAKSQKHVN